MKVKEHIHKYLRVINDNPPGYTVYKCVVPGCKHWLRKELLLARESICWVCGTAMILTQPDLNMKKPRHFACRRQPTVEEQEILVPAVEEEENVD